VGDVGERPAVHECGHPLGGLHQVRLDRVPQQRRHRADGAEIGGPHRAAVGTEADDDPRETLFQVLDSAREAEDRHHLARRRDVEARLAGIPSRCPPSRSRSRAGLGRSCRSRGATGRAGSPSPRALPWWRWLSTSAASRFVRGRHGVDVAREVEVDVHRGKQLRQSTAGPAALDAEVGAERGLAQRHGAADADPREPLRETDRGGGLPSPRRGRDRGDQDEPPGHLRPLARGARTLALCVP